jgi:hypothetical protein
MSFAANVGRRQEPQDRFVEAERGSARRTDLWIVRHPSAVYLVLESNGRY